MHGGRSQRTIGDAGGVLGGLRRTEPPATSGGQGDFIYLRWPKPDFARAARRGVSTPEHAAMFMAIYANLAPRPAGVVGGGESSALWTRLWRSSIDLLRLMWVEGIGSSLEHVRAVHDEGMRREAEGTGLEKYAAHASGRASRKGLSHGLDLTPKNRIRMEWLPRIGWPEDRRIGDDDAFGVMIGVEGRSRWYQAVSAETGGIARLGKGERHATEEEAFAELMIRVEAVLAERGRDKELGVGAKVLGRAGVRIGPENPRRGRRNAVPADMTGPLAMRGVEFGQFIGQRERQEVLNQTYDAFFDLCYVMRMPAAGASLWGRAGIAFGSRGIGPGVAGHFEPASWVVHMDRTLGAGVLAHEMGHAFDAALAEAAGLRRGRFLTEGVQAGWRDHVLARLMADVLTACRQDAKGGPTTFLTDALTLDSGRSGYWSSPAEMFARLFEAWVAETLARRGRRNDFLVSRSAASEEVAGLEWRAITSPYPKGAERRAMVAMMGDFMRAAMPIAQAALSAPRDMPELV